ncbi:MAG: hypothetical protein NVSMB1_05490 [Polyangiales bacterium]
MPRLFAPVPATPPTPVTPTARAMAAAISTAIFTAPAIAPDHARKKERLPNGVDGEGGAFGDIVDSGLAG